MNGGRGHPGILGYEPINEPHPVGLGKREFEERFLPEFYRNVLREIRRDSTSGLAGDPAAFIFLEPRFDWTTYGAEAPEFDGLAFTRQPESFLDTSEFAEERTVFSFHFYDPWTISFGADSMQNKAREWPPMYQLMREAATSRGLIPFITEFGGNHDWDHIDTDLRPAAYLRKQIRAYMDLSYQSVEAERLNAVYWHYDLYNGQEDKDNWNLENLSLLGPNRVPRHLDIVARPYPLRSSAEPGVLAFDIENKHFVVVLRGRPVDSTTIVFIPKRVHYTDGFDVRATSPDLLWDEENQLLRWLPDANADKHALVVSPAGVFNPSVIGQEERDLVELTAPRPIRPLPSVRIAAVDYDPVGPDVPREHVVVRNFSSRPIRLLGWRIQNVFNHPAGRPNTFTFPEFTLTGGSRVRVWTKQGRNDGGNLYWGRNQPAWSNNGDTAILRAASGVEVSRFSFPVYVPVPPAPPDLPPIPTPKSQIVDTTVHVPETSFDVDTGIDVEPNDEIQLDGGGEIWGGVWATGSNGPEGWAWIDSDPKFPLRNSHPYCLIARFGAAGDYFYVGRHRARQRYTGVERRRVFLRTNDDSPGNGTGEFTCRIQLWR
jgi:hypothetical protein